MKKTTYYLFLVGLCVLWSIVTLFSANAQPQTPFEIKWSMDGTLAGSGMASFDVSDAGLHGGIVQFHLNPYGSTGAVGQAAVTQRWPGEFDPSRYVEVAFTPISEGYEYDLHEVSFRLRRSNTGPPSVQVIGTFGGVGAGLATLSLPNGEVFYTFTLPINRRNLSIGSSVRFHGYGGSDMNNGTLWFDEIVVRGTTTNFVLPVRYTFTKAEALGERVEVAWQTALEHNSREFVVQRSKDLREWGDVGRVAAAGQSARLQTYAFVDPSPLLGVSYYRLRQVDQDGRYEYSAPFEVIFRPHGQYIRVLGNPVTDNAIRVKLFSVDPASLRLSTLTGQAVPFEAAQLGLDSWVLRPHHSLSSGLYLLHASQTHGLPLSVRVVVP